MIKYFTFPLLKRINQRSINWKLNRTLPKSFFKALDKSKKYPVVFSMIHNDDHIRLKFIHNEWGGASSEAWLDVSLADYETLPVSEAAAS